MSTTSEPATVNELPQTGSEPLEPQRLGDGIAEIRQAGANAVVATAWAAKLAQEMEGLVSSLIAGQASIHIKYLGGSEVAVRLVKDGPTH